MNPLLGPQGSGIQLTSDSAESFAPRSQAAATAKPGNWESLGRLASISLMNDQEPVEQIAKKRRGRPAGAQDKKPRCRRNGKQLEADNLAVPYEVRPQGRPKGSRDIVPRARRNQKSRARMEPQRVGGVEPVAESQHMQNRAGQSYVSPAVLARHQLVNSIMGNGGMNFWVPQAHPHYFGDLSGQMMAQHSPAGGLGDFMTHRGTPDQSVAGRGVFSMPQSYGSSWQHQQIGNIQYDPILAPIDGVSQQGAGKRSIPDFAQPLNINSAYSFMPGISTQMPSNLDMLNQQRSGLLQAPTMHYSPYMQLTPSGHNPTKVGYMPRAAGGGHTQHAEHGQHVGHQHGIPTSDTLLISAAGLEPGFEHPV